MAGRPYAGVVRVSHMGQRKAGAPNVHADREQLEDLRSHARQLGVPLRILPPELDVSGGLPLALRPSLREAVEGVERGKYAGIVVAYLSRLGRNVREQLAVWDRVEAVGGRIIVVREGIDTSTPAGRLQRTILLGVAEMELDMYSERFESLRQWATAAGIWQRRQTPRGYRKDAHTRRLVPDERAGEVRRAFRRHAAGETLSQLARELGMTPSGVRALLRNRVYLGELRVGKHVNAAAHPALVSEEEWSAAQRVRTARPTRNGSAPALLAGLVRCASCGHVMSRASGGTVSYACHAHHSAGQCPRPAAVSVAALDRHIDLLARQELAKLAASAATNDVELDAARRSVTDAERELAAYLDGVAAAGLEAEQWAEGARKRRQALEAARARRELLLARQRPVVDGDPVKAWQQMSPRQRNHQLRSLIEAVLVRPAGRGRRVPLGDRTRVIKHGAGLVEPYAGGGVAMPVRGVLWPDADSPVVLRVHLGEDLLERPGR
jgi:site-specific DNA recombinase